MYCYLVFINSAIIHSIAWIRFGQSMTASQLRHGIKSGRRKQRLRTILKCIKLAKFTLASEHWKKNIALTLFIYTRHLLRWQRVLTAVIHFQQKWQWLKFNL